MQPRALFICTTPRSGSTLLCDLVRQTGVLGLPESVFTERYMGAFATEFGLPAAVQADPVGRFDAYLDGVRAAGRSENGVFSTRLMAPARDDLDRWLAGLLPDAPDMPDRLAQAFGPPLYVHLTRKDRLGQAISLTRAELSGLWHAHSDGRPREGQRPPSDPVFERERIAARLVELDAEHRSWQAWFARHRLTPLSLTYEDLAGDPRAALRRLLAALGEDTGLAARAEVLTAKLADGLSRAWAVRFRS